MTTETTHDPATGSNAAWLSSLIGELLGIDEESIPSDRPLGELGIDSLTAAQLSVEVEERTGANIPLERFLGTETLQDLVREMGDGPAVTEEAGA